MNGRADGAELAGNEYAVNVRAQQQAHGIFVQSGPWSSSSEDCISSASTSSVGFEIEVGISKVSSMFVELSTRLFMLG